MGLILTAAIALYAVYYFSTLKERSLTSNLPNADRVEVETLNVHFETIKGVVAMRKLTRAQTEDLEHLWHSQSYIYGLNVMCHAPAYRLRFYKKDVLLTEATICFHCHNIYFYKYPGAKSPDDVIQVGFGSVFDLGRDRPPSPKLHAFLDNLFPNPKDQSVYSQLP